MSNLLHLAVIIFISMSLLTLSRNAQLVNVMETEIACINFTHSCNVYEVVLQAGYKPPFYHSRNGGILNLPPDQADRFFVENSNHTNDCSLNLTILNVHKDDAATYTCSIFKDIESIQEYKRVGLHVDYPPGKASCQLHDKQEGIWSSVQCTSSVGSLPGHIECYQNGKKMPPATDPVESNTSLMQTIWIENLDIVFCCSSSFLLPKQLCECSDSIIHPLYNRHIPNGDVCLATTSSEVAHMSPSQKPITSRNGVSTVPEEEIETTENSKKNVTTNIGVILGSVIAAFFLIIVVMATLLFRRYCDRCCHFCQENSGKGNENDEHIEQVELRALSSTDQDLAGDDPEAMQMTSTRKYETTNDELSLEHDA